MRVVKHYPQSKRSICFPGVALAVTAFCVVLTVLPYKQYSLWSGPRRDESILDLIAPAFTRPFDPMDILFVLSFLPILAPLLILGEFGFSTRSTPGRAVFFIQGFLFLCSAAWMLLIMNVHFLETDVRLLPTYYGVLCWVMVPGVLSFALMSRRIQNGLRRFNAYSSKKSLSFRSSPSIIPS